MLLRRWSSCCAVARLDSAIDKTAGQISLIAKPANRRCKIARISESQGFANAIKSLRLVESAALAFRSSTADISDGRLAVVEPLANRVRSGRKQP